MADSVNKTSMAERRTAAGRSIFRRDSVKDSAELRRIVELPRRDWEVGMGGRFGTTAELVALLTEQYRTPNGTQTLWPVQAIALAELHDFGGLVGPIRTSGGKTLISLLAAAALGIDDPTDALLLIPAYMLDITRIKWQALSAHWRLPTITFQTYDFLSREENRDWLTTLAPKLIVADEAGRLKNMSAACTKRVHWYMSDHPETVFLPLTGTPFNRSIQEVAHLVRWALPKFCPMPRDYGTLLEWSMCLDEAKVSANALMPGELRRLYNDAETTLAKTDSLRAARMAFARRFTETPGVVSVSDSGPDVALSIKGFDLDIDTPEVNKCFEDVRRYWRTPDGRPFAEAVKVWAHCRELACGFYYVWDPAPPKWWLDARRDWCRDLRHILAHNNRRLATEMQVAKAVQAGLYDVPSYWSWMDVRNDYKHTNVPIWVHDKTVQHAAEWLARHPRGICWVEHQAFADRLAEVSGYPLFGAGGRDGHGTMIEDASGPIIASVRSNGVGRDLQHNWSDNLVISCAPNGETWEQMLARTHRYMQPAKTVTVDVLLACREQYFGFQQAIRDSDMAATSLNQARKLLVADIQVEAIENIASKKATRWKTK